MSINAGGQMRPRRGEVGAEEEVVAEEGKEVVAELKPSSSINNIYSFQLGFTSLAPPPSDFEINDITVIYRAKRVK